MGGMGWEAEVDDGPRLPTPDAVFRIGILFAPALVALSGCSDDCVNSAISRADAPDGQHSAVMFQRDCGASTSFSTQISVLAQGEQPNEGGNIFIADDDHGVAATGEWGGPWADVRWLAHDHLLIRYANKSRLFKQERQGSDVKIGYQQVAR